MRYAIWNKSAMLMPCPYQYIPLLEIQSLSFRRYDPEGFHTLKLSVLYVLPLWISLTFGQNTGDIMMDVYDANVAWIVHGQ